MDAINTKGLATMTYRTEFPDFDPATMPAIPEGFVDTSWHNDSCPSFTNATRGIMLFVDYADPDEREFQESARFSLQDCSDTSKFVTIVLSDDWSDILAALS